MKIIRPVGVTQAGSITRSTTGYYVDKSGVLNQAAANILRVTYDLNNLSNPPYALIEQAATNLALYSSDFTNAVWTKQGGAQAPVITAAAGAAPDGTNTAQRAVMDRSGGTSSLLQQYASMAAGTSYVASVFLKSNTGLPQTVLLLSWSGDKRVTVDETWKRFDIQGVAGPGGAQFAIGTSSSLLGGDVSLDLLMWGAQIETGTTATSYIATTASTVARAADVVATNGLLYSNVPENDYAVWDATKIYIAGDRILDTTAHKIYESVTGRAGTVTLTVASPCVVTMTDSTGVAFTPADGTPIQFSTTGALPTGIVAGTTYYVKSPTATTFNISATKGSAAINTTGSQTGTHSARVSSNFNQVAPNVTYWLDAGMDNRWEMFDQSITSQTTMASEIVVAFAPGQRLDSVIGLNCAASSASVTFTDVGSGEVVYSAIVNMVSDSGIQDLYAYMYEPIVQVPEFLVTDVPLGISTSAIITVRFSVSAGNTAVGGLVFGLAREIGFTEWGAKVSTVDYSVKTKDSFGNYVITPRAFSKKGDFTVQVPTGSVDYLQNLLAQFRATPVVYIGSNSGKTQFNSTIIFGFYKDFTIDIGYHSYSVCSMSIEGLT